MSKPWVTAQKSWDFGSAQPKLWIDGDKVWIKEFAESPRSVTLDAIGEVTARMGVLNRIVDFFGHSGIQITRVRLPSSTHGNLARDLVETIRKARSSTSAATDAPLVADEIQKLADLRESGALSEEEFSAIKRRLVNLPKVAPNMEELEESSLEDDSEFNTAKDLCRDNVESPNDQVNTMRVKRKVGFGLFLGIGVLPYVFSWFTLRKRHTAKARIAAFVWLSVMHVYMTSSVLEPNTAVGKGGEVSGAGSVICDRFEIRSEVNGNELRMSIDTDLPDSAVLIVGARRLYRQTGSSSDYSHVYFSEHSTVGDWREARVINLNHEKWEREVEGKRQEMAWLGNQYDVASIDQKGIRVSAVLPSHAPNERQFGKSNSKLSGNAVNKTGHVRDEKWVGWPARLFPKKPITITDAMSLKVGKTYQIQDNVPLMPHYDPPDPLAAIAQMQTLSKGSKITVREIANKGIVRWYRVNTNQNMKGWINGIALIGQKIQIVEKF